GEVGTDRAKIRDGITALRDFPGVTGLTSFAPNGDAVKPVLILQVKNGDFTRVRQHPSPGLPSRWQDVDFFRAEFGCLHPGAAADRPVCLWADAGKQVCPPKGSSIRNRANCLGTEAPRRRRALGGACRCLLGIARGGTSGTGRKGVLRECSLIGSPAGA